MALGAFIGNFLKNGILGMGFAVILLIVLELFGLETNVKVKSKLFTKIKRVNEGKRKSVT